jgi:hypothetical protein
VTQEFASLKLSPLQGGPSGARLNTAQESRSPLANTVAGVVGISRTASDLEALQNRGSRDLCHERVGNAGNGGGSGRKTSRSNTENGGTERGGHGQESSGYDVSLLLYYSKRLPKRYSLI